MNQMSSDIYERSHNEQPYGTCLYILRLIIDFIKSLRSYSINFWIGWISHIVQSVFDPLQNHNTHYLTGVWSSESVSFLWGFGGWIVLQVNFPTVIHNWVYHKKNKSWITWFYQWIKYHTPTHKMLPNDSIKRGFTPALTGQNQCQ